MAKLHVVALPHVKIGSPTAHLCAYTGAKLTNFIKMMKERHDLVIYAPECDPIPGVTMVNCLSQEQRIKTFGEDEANRLPAWPTDLQSRSFNYRAAAEILDRVQEPQEELVLLIGGLTHKPILDMLPHMICCEPFCGYEGIMTDKVAFESYFHMAQVYMQCRHRDVRWFDAPVIHPFFDPDEFPVTEPARAQEYLLYLGRLIARKSIRLGGEISKATGLPLVVAGSGMKEYEEGKFLAAEDGTRIECDVRYFGPVSIQRRAQLLQDARATLTLTTFMEPGCNVMFESLACGTPVICTDAGIFPEVITNGFNGFRVHSMMEAVDAVERSANLDRDKIRSRVKEFFSLEATVPKFEAWFARLQTLWGKGFYAE